MTLVTIGDYTFNPEAIDLVKGDREDYCEVFFRMMKHCFHIIVFAPGDRLLGSG